MKITPIEIRQKTFAKAIRGYEKEEVDAFLASLSQEWERVMGEMQQLKQRLAQSENDVQKLREVESSLYRTLKMAEDTGANLLEQANRDASLQLREAQIQAEALLNDAKNYARDLIDDAELRAREVSEDLKEEVRKLESDYKTLESYRDNLILEMKNFAKNTLDRLDAQRFQKVDFHRIIKGLNQELETQEVKKEPIVYKEEVVQENVVQWEVTSSKETAIEAEDEKTQPDDVQQDDVEPKKGSFFDTLG